VAQAGLRAAAAEPDVPAVAQVVLRAVEPDALVEERGGFRALAAGLDALAGAQGGPPAVWAGLWFRVVELYAWAAAVPPVLAVAWAGLWFRVVELYAWAAAVPPVLAVAWAGLWFRVVELYAWAVAVQQVCSGALAVRVPCGVAALAAHGLAARLGAQVHWAWQRVHLGARVSRPVWWPAGWGVPAHWALRLAWGAALRVRLAAWRALESRAVQLAALAARRVADAPRQVRDEFPRVRLGLPR
jgi:hypothetical protein